MKLLTLLPVHTHMLCDEHDNENRIEYWLESAQLNMTDNKLVYSVSKKIFRKTTGYIREIDHLKLEVKLSSWQHQLYLLKKKLHE